MSSKPPVDPQEAPQLAAGSLPPWKVAEPTTASPCGPDWTRS